VKTRALILIVLLATTGGGSLAVAQYVDDEEMEDHRRQDEEYYKRYLEDQEEDPMAADEAAMAEAFLAKADELIRDKNYRSRYGKRYQVQTDDPRVDLESVVDLLEYFRDFFEEAWSSRLELEPYDKQARIFLFYSYHKYNKLIGGDWSRQVLRPKGHYGSLFDAVVMHTDSDRPGGLPNTLVHESAHQLIDQLLYGGTVRPSLWIAEGMASYYENTFMTAEGVFEAGVIGGKQISCLRGTKDKAVSDARPRIRMAREAFDVAASEDKQLMLMIVSADDPSEFYGGNVLANYDLAWLLVHFLLHGDDGAHASAFARYLQLEAAGQGGVEAFFSETGLSPDELDQAVLRHLRNLKAR
jgi:hypothetical protein